MLRRYVLGVTGILLATAPPAQPPDGLLVVAAAKRVAKAWACVLCASAVTTGLKASAAVALTPIFNNLLCRLGTTFQIESRWRAAGLVALAKCGAFAAVMALLVANEMFRVSEASGAAG